MEREWKKKKVLQKGIDKDAECRSFSWKILRQAKVAVGAKTYVGDTAFTAFTAPPFFDNADRRDAILWGARALGPRVISWT